MNANPQSRAQRAIGTAVPLLLLLFSLLSPARAQVPGAINYQGRLTDSLGNPLTNGYYVVQFKIWADPAKTGDGDYVWGRSFPVHVVTGGLFNVLLTDDGGLVGSPLNTDIRAAFSGAGRYLGLTITAGPSGNIAAPVEISPRQRLVSAPYAFQAQTANQVIAAAIGTTQLQDGSVTTPKLADQAVTGGKIASGTVGSLQIADTSVTSAKLAIDDDVFLNGHKLQVRLQDQPNVVVADFVTWDPAYDGIALYGRNGGLLGYTRGTEASPAPVLAWTWQGNVGIGTTNPARARLEIEGNAPYLISTYGYLNESNPTGKISSNPVPQPYSIYASDRIAAVEFNAFSDARLKQVRGRSDGAEDLARLLQIEVTDYQLVDQVAKGDRTYKKVIAQQVEGVYPEAVSRATEVVPDIYAKAEARDGWIPLGTAPKTPIQVGDRVKIITETGAGMHEVAAVEAQGFRVATPLNGPVFVYGREVQDFRLVDYEAIAMLNVSATQELHSRLRAVEGQAAALAQQNAALQQRLAKLEA
ncbi:MAG: tail fiber domain-containing protein, partial [Verrucomicrobiae bacterium]|nr:tail fiber domain-containing protein [Verrucomicrobiae bacterium]